MLIRPSHLQKYWGITPTGVLHVGAHEAEEAPLYKMQLWGPVIWIEAQPNLCRQLENSLSGSDDRIIEAAIFDVSGVEMDFHVASNSQSSSLLDFQQHSILYPGVHMAEDFKVTTKRLDEILTLEEMPNFINLDIQGAELPALKSLGSLLAKLDFIYIEVNKREIYKNIPQLSDIDSFLSSHDFRRVGTLWVLNKGWGDAIYTRNSLNKNYDFFSKLKWSIFKLKNYAAQILLQIKVIGVDLRSFIAQN